MAVYGRLTVKNCFLLDLGANLGNSIRIDRWMYVLIVDQMVFPLNH